jgi:outer membrane murein-binding lipoprotein Lpp
LLCASTLLAGCFSFRRKQPVRRWNAANALKSVYVPQISAGDPAKIVAPDIVWEIPEASLQTILFRGTPVRPKVAAPVNPVAITGPEKTEPPVITIQLSPQESTLARQEANESMRMAEANLKATHGHTLNYAQADLASKVSGFLEYREDSGEKGASAFRRADCLALAVRIGASPDET